MNDRRCPFVFAITFVKIKHESAQSGCRSYATDTSRH